jgi:hypothetical protein
VRPRCSSIVGSSIGSAGSGYRDGIRSYNTIATGSAVGAPAQDATGLFSRDKDTHHKCVQHLHEVVHFDAPEGPPLYRWANTAQWLKCGGINQHLNARKKHASGTMVMFLRFARYTVESSIR